MNTRQFFKPRLLKLVCNAIAIFCVAVSPALALTTDIDSSPIGTAQTIAAQPNIMVMLDDSGSMDWDYMPDTAGQFAGNYGFNSAHCNGVYYNPNITYTIPVDSQGNNLNNSAQTSFNHAYNDGYKTSSGWVDLNSQFPGGSGSGSSSAPNYTGPAFYYNYTGTQTLPWQMNYNNTASTFYNECNSGTVGGTSPSVPASTDHFTLVTMSSANPTTTITVSSPAGSPATIIVLCSNGTTGSNSHSCGTGTSNTITVSSITVNGVQILTGGTTSGSTNLYTAVSRIVSNIGAAGYSAVCASVSAGACNSNIINLTGPGSASSYSPVVTISHGTYSATPFPTVTSTAVSNISVGGVNLLSGTTSASNTSTQLAGYIVQNLTTTGYTATCPGYNATSHTCTSGVVTVTNSTGSASGVTPVVTTCLGVSPFTCYTPPISVPGGLTVTPGSFSTSATAAQLQNFANWYSYYSHRMLMMKSGLGLAFKPVTNTYRVGFMTLNNNVSPDFLDILSFDGSCAAGTGTCQKDKWYTKLYASIASNSTPLREALSHVGQLYAHKFGTTTNYTATITVNGSGTTAATSVTVNGTELLNCAFNNLPCPAGATTSALAQIIVNQINAMVQTDYGATAVGNVVTITGIAGSVGYPPVVSDDGGNMTFASTNFVASTGAANSLNGVTPLDPMQYSCQQNFVILSTDGFWNGPSTYDLNNNAVGQQDGGEPRPMNDGGTSTTQRTSQIFMSTSQLNQLQSQTDTLQSQTSNLQSSTSNLQSSTMYLESSTKASSVAAWTSYAAAASCTWKTSGTYPYTQCRYATTSGGSTVWSAAAATWTNAASCTTSFSSTTTNGTVWTGNGTSCQYSPYSTPVNASSCTTVAQDGTSPYTVATATTCSYLDGSWNTATSCTVVAKSGSSPYTVGISTQCQYSLGGYTNTALCTPVAQSPSSPYTVAIATDCQTIPSSSCTSGTNGCSTITTGPTAVATCTAASPISSNHYTTTTCNTVTTGPTPVSSCTAASASSANNFTTTTCTAGSGGTPNTLADVAEYYYVTDLRDSSLNNCTGALGLDVCYDDVPSPLGSRDNATWQHMTTFTLGLGARGSMVFSPTYLNLTASCNTATDGDFCAVYKGVATPGSTASDGSTICSWQTTTGTCNWPVPSSGSLNNIDDLWHAAVNGRGAYYSATDPATLASGLNSTLQLIGAQNGNSAAATTSNPNISASNNFLFSSSYQTMTWTGDVTCKYIDLTSGAITTSCWGATVDSQGNPITLDALSRLTTLVNQTTPGGGNRKIYTDNPSPSNTYSGDPAWLKTGQLKSFTFANLTTTEQGYFTNITGLSQYTSLTATQKPLAANGTNLVNYLRGDSTYECPTTDLVKSCYYRARSSLYLGDIVDSKAAYVGVPAFNYGDTNYTAYATAQASRSGMVYAGSNDGMLHAFNAVDNPTVSSPPCVAGTGQVCGGDEAWAFIPDLVEPNLYKLADMNYATNHEFLVDGTPVVGDICPNAPTSTCPSTGGSSAGQWKTILVGGLNDGGTGYYALDVTIPTQPQLLWEFTDTNMGLSYGNPQITKLADGTWVVLLTSGYNNTTGDGKGHLYVLNANTGALIRDISTGVGSATTPSGLARISARVLNPATDNTAVEVYGGDLLGNLWRFDINNNVGSSQSNYEAQLIVKLTDALGNAQPITSKPEIGLVNNNLVIFVGTGKMLGTSDLTTSLVQTMYAIKDPLTVSTTALPGTAIYTTPPQGPSGANSTCTTTLTTNCFVQQTAVDTTCPTGSPASICSTGNAVRTGSNNAVSFTTQSGWYINFPDSGERDNTDPILALGTLGFTTNTPTSQNGCSSQGYSYSWFLNYSTGAPVSTSTTAVISIKLGTPTGTGGAVNSAFATSPTYFSLPNGTIKEVTCLSNGTCVENTPAIGNSSGSTRRSSWRELILQ